MAEVVIVGFDTKVITVPDLGEKYGHSFHPLDAKYDPLAEKGVAPGTRVLVFDSTLFKDDISTPKTHTMRPATVVKHYGLQAEEYYLNDSVLGPYESSVDVIFDHRPERISRGHFTWGIKLLAPENDTECHCLTSTGICGYLTRGIGKLDDYGYWEFPCPHGNDCVEYVG